MATGCSAAYRARSPRATPLYRLFDADFEEVNGQWEGRFERRYGFWRGFVDEQVLRYLDCGLYENGFARIRCPVCAEEFPLAFSCKTRELCPSCAAKRSAVTAALLAEDVLEEVAHAQWVFVIPKMLRSHFLHKEAAGGATRSSRRLMSVLWRTDLPQLLGAPDVIQSRISWICDWRRFRWPSSRKVTRTLLSGLEGMTRVPGSVVAGTLTRLE